MTGKTDGAWTKANDGGYRFYNGRQCLKDGHGVRRYVATGHCVECARQTARDAKARSRLKPRAAAIKAGRKTYYTGKLCKHGHQVIDRQCVVCRQACKMARGEREKKRRVEACVLKMNRRAIDAIHADTGYAETSEFPDYVWATDDE